VTPAKKEGPEPRWAKAAAQREAAQFGIIALLSTLPRAADAPSAWTRAVPTGRYSHDDARDPMFDGSIDAPLRSAFSSR
jgi:hypothetical protein